MSYIVLARKYRSRNFSEMVGQEHVVQALSNALTQGRLHHAYLFTGTRGVGKTTVSRILAKALNCLGPDGQGGITATPCGVCQACRDIDAGRFIDYTELDAASNRGVDEVQSLLEQAVYKPVVGRFKVFMIDEVHMLSNTAFNAMLKTLEEPPEYLKFVLATTDPQKVPVTVLSRCLQFSLRPMAPDTVRGHLEHVLSAEGVNADAGSLRLIARAARGSMRDALSLTDQAIAFGSGRLEEGAVRQMLGAVDRTHVFRLLEALARSDGRSLVDTIDTLRLHGLSAGSALEDVCAVLQRMAVIQAVASAEAVDPDDPEATDLARLAALMPADETQLLYSICLHGQSELGLAPDEYAGLTMVLLRLLAFKPAVNGNLAQSAIPALAEKKSLIRAESPGPTAARPLEPAARAVPPQAGNTGAAADEPAWPASSEPDPAAPTFAATSAPAPALGPVPGPSHWPAPAPGLASASGGAPVGPQRPAPVSASAQPPAGFPNASARPPPALPSHAGAGAANEVAMPGTPATGRSLPVVDPASGAGGGLASRPAVDSAAQATAPVMAMPVRVQPEPRAGSPDDARSPATWTPTPEGDFWHATVQSLVERELISAMARELALQSQLVGRDSDQWMLRVERETLNQPGQRERLQKALAAIGHPVSLAVEIGPVTDSPARRNAAAAQERQRAAEGLILGDPWVQSMMQEFGAKIVPGSIKPLLPASGGDLG